MDGRQRGPRPGDVPPAAFEPVDAERSEPRALPERQVRRAAPSGPSHHRREEASRALSTGPAHPGRRPAVDLHRPRDPDGGPQQARAGLQAAPELRPPCRDRHAAVKRYLARRLLLLVPVLAGVSVIIFMVLHLSPGDPVEIMLGSQATQEDRTRLRADLGLDQPLHVQYARWLGHLARGDLGRSLWMKRPVLGEVVLRFQATLILTATALVLSTTAGIALGVASAT